MATGQRVELRVRWQIWSLSPTDSMKPEPGTMDNLNSPTPPARASVGKIAGYVFTPPALPPPSPLSCYTRRANLFVIKLVQIAWLVPDHIFKVGFQLIVEH